MSFFGDIGAALGIGIGSAFGIPPQLTTSILTGVGAIDAPAPISIVPSAVGPGGIPAIGAPIGAVNPNTGRPAGIDGGGSVAAIGPIGGGQTISADEAGRVITWLQALGGGMGDSALRGLARQLRIGKNVILQGLQNLGQLGASVLPPASKILMSNEVEKIFKRKRRGVISKSLRNALKQMKFIRKEARFLFPKS